MKDLLWKSAKAALSDRFLDEIVIVSTALPIHRNCCLYVYYFLHNYIIQGIQIPDDSTKMNLGIPANAVIIVQNNKLISVGIV